MTPDTSGPCVPAGRVCAGAASAMANDAGGGNSALVCACSMAGGIRSDEWYDDRMVGGSEDEGDGDDDVGYADVDAGDEADESAWRTLNSSAGHGRLASGHAVSAGSHGCVRSTEMKSARLNGAPPLPLPPADV